MHSEFSRQLVDEAESQIYKQKLQLEIKQLKQRELLYEQKRKELIELEAMYRKGQSTQVQKRKNGVSKGNTNGLIIQTL